MEITILLFSSLRDKVGQNKLTLRLPGDTATVDDVRRALVTQFPPLEQVMPIALASVNREYAFDEDVVSEGDEVAFFPPVSGGSSASWPEIFRLPYEPISYDEIIAAVTTPETGAVAVFGGAVRGVTHKDGDSSVLETEKLTYEAYAPMALEKMRQVAAEIRERWPLVLGIAIIQRLGELQVGEPTIAIACAAAHRDQGCFEAARYGIDRVKEIVPVWKKEIGADGEEWVEGAYTPTPQDRAAGQG